MSEALRQLSNARVSVKSLNSTGPIEALCVVSLDSTGGIGSPGASSTQVSLREILTSSGASVMDSTNGAIKVNVVAGAAGGSTIMTISTGSVRVHQSSAADLNVTVAGYSTVASVSTGSVRVHQSTAADLLARVSQGPPQSTASEAWLVALTDSSNAIVKPADSANNALRVNIVADNAGSGVGNDTGIIVGGQSTIALVIGLTYGWDGSTNWNKVEASSYVPPSTQRGLLVREIRPTAESTTALITSTHSTAVYSLISSAAGLRQKVYAYFVGSTHTNPSTLVFMSSLAIDRWHVHFGSGSSGMTGANMAVGIPAWLFQTDVANALNVRIEGGSSVTATCVARISLGHFSSTGG